MLLTGTLLCKSQELSRREHSMSRVCSIHHAIPVAMHTPAAYGQWSVFNHNGDNQLAVLGAIYGIWWPWYDQFEVGWLKTLQLWLGAGTSSVAPVLVSQDRDLYHVQLHPIWFEPTSECRSWPVVSYLYSGHLPVGLSWLRVSFASWSTLSFPSMPQWLGTQQKRTRVPLSLNDRSRFMIWQIKGFSVSSPSTATWKVLWYQIFPRSCSCRAFIQSAHWKKNNCLRYMKTGHTCTRCCLEFLMIWICLMELVYGYNIDA